MGRLFQFRNEVMLLWRAFLTPGTPLWLKALMLLVPLYLVSPIDFIPDFIPILGWLDDIVVIPLLVSWLVGLLPRQRAEACPNRDRNGPTIEGDYRRM